MARLKPKESTVKKLFALSGNNCAFPECEEMLVDKDGELIGEISHIEAAEEGGIRFNPEMSDEERRGFENLILMCPNHHKKIDKNEKYSVEILQEFKEKQEKNKTNSLEVSDQVIKEAITKFMVKSENNSGNQFINQAEKQNIGSQIGTQNIYSSKNDNDNSIEGYREVIPELKRKMDKLKQEASPPKEEVIDFGNDRLNKRSRDVYELPVNELLFRKENGRIKAEITSYEKIHGEIDEKTIDGQNIIRGFLINSDPKKREALKKQIKHKGQLQPAIVTCDGFLINGNRRKMIFEELLKESHGDSGYSNLRVVILPTNVKRIDIKKIENRYQLQDEGKSEYIGLNRALTIRDNIDDNYSLEAQILDDPLYADKAGNSKELKKVKDEVYKNFLNPLGCVDRYLELFNRPKLYDTISSGTGDSKGRWQAFIDYSNFYHTYLLNDKQRQNLGIQKVEVPLIEEAIFKIIRKRQLDSKELQKALGKVHSFVRSTNLKKYLKNEVAKKSILNIAKEVDRDIPEKEKQDKNGKNHSEREVDRIWGKNNSKAILEPLAKAYKAVNNREEREKPLEILEVALKKLYHDNLNIQKMDTSYYDDALDFLKQIELRAKELHKEVDSERFKLKKLGKRKRL